MIVRRLTVLVNIYYLKYKRAINLNQTQLQ